MQWQALELSAYGWAPADWQQVFYPDDLPTEWQSSYYANEFRQVLLPAQIWEQPEQQLALWQEEVSEGFQFYIEVDQALLHTAHWQALQSLLPSLQQQLGGIVVEAALAEQLPARWQDSLPIHLRQPGEVLAALPNQAGCQLGIVKQVHVTSPLLLRQLFEHLQQHAQHQHVLLFVDAPWSMLEQIRLMQQVYGV